MRFRPTSSRSRSRRSSSRSRASAATATAARSASTPAGSRSAARGWSTRTSSGSSATTRRSCPGSRSAGARAHRASPPRAPRHPRPLGERPPLPGAVLDEVPLTWLREYARPDVAVEAIAERLSRLDVRGRADRPPRRSRATSASSASARCSPPRSTRTRTGSSSAVVDVGGKRAADRLRRVELRRRGDRRRRASRARRCRTGSRSSGASCAAQMSDGMILAEDEVDLGADHAGIMLLADDLEPGTPLADVLPLVDDVLEIETTPNRPDLLSIYGLAREVAALFDVPLAPWPGVDPPRAGDEAVAVDVEDCEGCPRYLARLFRDVAIGPSPVWLKARVARRRHAPDLERRRRDELRHARARQPAARVRPRHARGRAGRRPPRARRRGDPHARRHAPAARPPRHGDHGRRARDRARRDHGRRGDRGHRGDDERPARGGELRAGRDPPHLRAARAAHRGVEPVGEGRRPVPRRARGPARDAAHRRDVRRALGGRDRRARRAAGAAASSSCGPRAHERAASASTYPPTSSAASSAGSGSTSTATR